jgi:metal-responsive CopG/Arc/MetJ family transcriptional regulator
MPSTTVHIPDKLLSKIDQIVKEKGISRNRFITQACEEAVSNSSGQWPEDFFEMEHDEENMNLLREAGLEMEEAIISARKNRQDFNL